MQLKQALECPDVPSDTTHHNTLHAQVDDGEVLCKAQNTAELCGLLTVFLVERSESGVENMQVCVCEKQ